MAFSTGILSSAILHDPMILIELCAVFFAFCYITKLAFTPLTVPFDECGLKQQHALDSARSRRESGLSGFFGVGELISLPKRSLRNQPHIRRRLG